MADNKAYRFHPYAKTRKDYREKNPGSNLHGYRNRDNQARSFNEERNFNHQADTNWKNRSTAGRRHDQRFNDKPRNRDNQATYNADRSFSQANNNWKNSSTDRRSFFDKPEDNLSPEERANPDTGMGNGVQLERKRKRGFTFGCKHLENLLSLEPFQTLISLITDYSELEEFLNADNMTDTNVSLFLGVLVRCADSNIQMQNKYKVFTLVLRSKFFTNHVPAHLNGMLKEKCTNKKENFPKTLHNLSIVLNQLLDTFPMSAADQLASCTMQSVGVATEICKDEESKADKIMELRHYEEPPNDFRDLHVIPNSNDLLRGKEEFVRPNITMGNYHSVDHYLDVQFRLLREDFLQPLREGLREYLKLSKNKNKRIKLQDVRVYSGVQILESGFARNGLFHEISFDKTNLPNVNWEITKRLMYGSLLCLSDDGFKTIFMATVTGRKSDDLKMGKLQVRFEETLTKESQLSKDSTYVMIESQAFFESYKHVLKGLQEFDESNLPMQRYIVHACKEVCSPAYLTPENYMDLGSLVDVIPKRQTETENAKHLHVFISDNYSSRMTSHFSKPVVYYEVKFEEIRPNRGFVVHPNRLHEHILEISNSDMIRLKKQEGPERGSLLCFSNDQFQTVFLATVVDRKFGRRFQIEIKNAAPPSELQPYGPYVMLECKLKAEDREIEDLLGHRRNEIQIHKEAFEDLLDLVKKFSDEIVFRPMEEIGGVFEPELPVKVLDNTKWPSKDTFGLDDSQYTALRNALTSEICVIQGPPGTGKTFIGLKIVKTLLRNKAVCGNEPILIVCYTNYALDQFLEGMLVFTNRLVRVGGKKDSVLSDYNLTRLRDRMVGQKERDSYVHNFLRKRRMTLQNVRDDAIKLQENIRLSYSGLLNDNILQDVIQCPVFNQLVTTFNEYNAGGKHPPSILAAWLQLSFVDFIPSEALGFFKYYNLEEEQEENRTSSYCIMVDMNEAAGPDAEKEIDKYQEEFVDVDNDVATENERRMLEESNVAEDEKASHRLKAFLEEHKGNTMAIQLDDIKEYYRKELKFYGLCNNDGFVSNKTYSDLTYKEGKVTRTLQKELSLTTTIPEERFEGIDLWSMPVDARWKLYRTWLQKYMDVCKARLKQLTKDYEEELRGEDEVRKQEELEILKGADIVGMTTTGAAKHRLVLQALRPKIVVVEEAAEVLEAHLITTLSKSTKHLILIGDHQQLRPKPTVYKLAKDYNLEISFFERMIKNGFPYVTLQEQHRMRPEIARLLVPHIYKSLKNHESVNSYESVKGMKTNLYFLNHNKQENEVGDLKSHANDFEAEILSRLCRHLLFQGYLPQQITILAAYTGQMFALRKKMPKSIFSGVRVTVVDNYQGEENDIILLSLVRSNEIGKIGFLNTANRVCVALSRAKKGLYCIGNFDLLSEKNDLWKNLVTMLETENMTGTSLPLDCQIHPQEEILVSSTRDFDLKSPEGGCLNECLFRLSCNHVCKSVCHPRDRDHNEYVCKESCSKLCERMHPCPNLCHEPCNPCSVMVDKTLECGHVTQMKCHADPKFYSCSVSVERDLPKCDHKGTMSCCIPAADFKCKVIVTRTLPCAHEREMKCHEDEKKANCHSICDYRLNCGHRCDRHCHTKSGDEHEERKCRKKCEKSCENDHDCKLRCYEKCLPCQKRVKKKLPCDHTSMIKCSVMPEDIECHLPCEKTLTCSHPCPRLCFSECGGCQVRVDKIIPGCGHSCSMPCSSINFKPCLVRVEKELLCGHKQKIPCNQKDHEPMSLLIYCKEPCGSILECEHPCKGFCGDCRQGRMHVSCQEKCGRPRICGHNCGIPCASTCPPCNKKCENRCVHSKCPNKCGVPCKPCIERCSWQCKHKKCTKRCGELCNRDSCDEPCKEKLKCGHDCVGLCGEPCPSLCRICHKDKLTELLFGNEDEEGARFVHLPDCRHCIEVGGMDKWMMQSDNGEIVMKLCPKCKAPIRTCRRYNNVIKQTMRDITEVVKKIHGGDSTGWKFRQLTDEVNNLLKMKKLAIMDDLINLKKVLDLNRRKGMSKYELLLLENQIAFIKRLGNIVTDRLCNLSNKKYVDAIHADMKHLKSRIIIGANKISKEEINQISFEIVRLSFLAEFYRVQEKIDQGTTINAQALAEYDVIRNNLWNLKPFTEREESLMNQSFKRLQQFMGGLGISEVERRQIIQAMEMSKGHWFKCPNGHIYAIGECGGAEETGQCNECGARIGGGNHRLLSDNTLASEMDGSTRPAWPQGPNF